MLTKTLACLSLLFRSVIYALIWGAFYGLMVLFCYCCGNLFEFLHSVHYPGHEYIHNNSVLMAIPITGGVYLAFSLALIPCDNSSWVARCLGELALTPIFLGAISMVAVAVLWLIGNVSSQTFVTTLFVGLIVLDFLAQLVLSTYIDSGFFAKEIPAT